MGGSGAFAGAILQIMKRGSPAVAPRASSTSTASRSPYSPCPSPMGLARIASTAPSGSSRPRERKASVSHSAVTPSARPTTGTPVFLPTRT